MKISIDEEVCKKYGTSLDEVLTLAAIAKGSDEIYQDIIKKGYASKYNGSFYQLDKKLSLTPIGAELVDNVVLESDKDLVPLEDPINKLAIELRNIYPSGKMSGTNYYYRGNVPDIEKKLKSFIKRYGNVYTFEQIIKATKAYVSSFNGNYTYLKLLKYFIWKSEVKDGETVITSVLADWIENEGQEDSLKRDWVATLC